MPYSKHRNPETMYTGESLAKEINKSWLTIATKSINNLLLAKYYEIPMFGSVVCGDYPDLEDETFLRDHMVYIDIDMSDEQILSTIKEALKDKKTLLELSEITHEYFLNKYTIDRGVIYFDNLIDKISDHTDI